MPEQPNYRWLDGIQVAFTYCDESGLVLDMNQASADTFAEDGGRQLIGQSALECHPEPARSKLQELLKLPALNVYTIEKAGRRKMIYQVPVWDGEIFKGIVEISLPLPDSIPHFVRG